MRASQSTSVAEQGKKKETKIVTCVSIARFEVLGKRKIYKKNTIIHKSASSSILYCNFVMYLFLSSKEHKNICGKYCFSQLGVCARARYTYSGVRDGEERSLMVYITIFNTTSRCTIVTCVTIPRNTMAANRAPYVLFSCAVSKSCATIALSISRFYIHNAILPFRMNFELYFFARRSFSKDNRPFENRQARKKWPTKRVEPINFSLRTWSRQLQRDSSDWGESYFSTNDCPTGLFQWESSASWAYTFVGKSKLKNE